MLCILSIIRYSAKVNERNRKKVPNLAFHHLHAGFFWGGGARGGREGGKVEEPAALFGAKGMWRKCFLCSGGEVRGEPKSKPKLTGSLEV